MSINILQLVLLLQLGSSIAVDDKTITISRQLNDDNSRERHKSAENWELRHFPEKTNEPEFEPRSIFANQNDSTEDDTAECDDGTQHLAYDWDESMTQAHTCTEGVLKHNDTIAPIVHSAWIPPMYTAPHYCMNTNISYSDPLITYGGHRKLWARYGEYKFVPKQRWLHNAENGAVIMLYHPCADPDQVENLRKIVRSCLYRHIITPYNLLPKERPLALVTWGWQLSMNGVRSTSVLVRRFIREHALKAPRNLKFDGQYEYALKSPAKIVSDENDSRLCTTIM